MLRRKIAVTLLVCYPSLLLAEAFGGVHTAFFTRKKNKYAKKNCSVAYPFPPTP